MPTVQGRGMLAVLYFCCMCLAMAANAPPDTIIDSARESGAEPSSTGDPHPHPPAPAPAPAPSPPLVAVVRSPRTEARFMTFGRSVVGAQFLDPNAVLEPAFAGFAVMAAARYTRAFAARPTPLASPLPPNALAIGLGAASVPNLLRSEGIRTDVIEISEAVARMASKHFGFDDCRIPVTTPRPRPRPPSPPPAGSGADATAAVAALRDAAVECATVALRSGKRAGTVAGTGTDTGTGAGATTGAATGAREREGGRTAPTGGTTQELPTDAEQLSLHELLARVRGGLCPGLADLFSLARIAIDIDTRAAKVSMQNGSIVGAGTGNGDSNKTAATHCGHGATLIGDALQIIEDTSPTAPYGMVIADLFVGEKVEDVRYEAPRAGASTSATASDLSRPFVQRVKEAWLAKGKGVFVLNVVGDVVDAATASTRLPQHQWPRARRMRAALRKVFKNVRAFADEPAEQQHELQPAGGTTDIPGSGARARASNIIFFASDGDLELIDVRIAQRRALLAAGVSEDNPPPGSTAWVERYFTNWELFVGGGNGNSDHDGGDGGSGNGSSDFDVDGKKTQVLERERRAVAMSMWAHAQELLQARVWRQLGYAADPSALVAAEAAGGSVAMDGWPALRMHLWNDNATANGKANTSGALEFDVPLSVLVSEAHAAASAAIRGTDGDGSGGAATARVAAEAAMHDALWHAAWHSVADWWGQLRLPVLDAAAHRNAVREREHAAKQLSVPSIEMLQQARGIVLMPAPVDSGHLCMLVHCLLRRAGNHWTPSWLGEPPYQGPGCGGVGANANAGAGAPLAGVAAKLLYRFRYG